jgi:ATP-dependent DNA helicase RecG
MYKIQDSVSLLPKVGPKYKKILEKLGIFTIEDLLYYFPFRYEDFSNLRPAAEVEEGTVVTVKGVLEKAENIFTRNGKRLTFARITDFSGSVDAVWFNQHYLKQSLKPGSGYQLSGKVDEFNHKPSLISPEIEVSSDNPIHTGRLVPIYSETYGVSSKYIRTRINDVLSKFERLDDFLPETLIKKHNLKPLDEAIRDFHFPPTEFDAKHARSRFEFEEVFLELLKVEDRKNSWRVKTKGPAFESSKFKSQTDSFIKNLPFELTESQKNAVEEIISDMTKVHPMNRLLEGDVGTGKTIVAIIAAYFAYLNEYKTLYMAPTEILANQHFETFRKFLNNYGIKVELMTGSKKSDKKDWDILIGTHALLFNNTNFNKIGLVVIDEQHRFGVEQRAKILELGESGLVPHLLTMTATPIPRTLALTLFGDLSISNLLTPPNENKKITTKVVPDKQRQEAYELVKKKNEQTFIVCPLIEESESISLENVKAAEAHYLSLKNGVFSGTSIGLLHGRMKPKEKQEVIEQFRKGEIQVLVSTPVIEVGIDVPEATVMIIESAERYGLASLHQLRGRVGRGDKPGICLIFMSNDSKSSYERLKNLETHSNGLDLAEIDMKLRGYGDLYGTMQHGFKQFRVADITNLELLGMAQQAAEEVFPKLDSYPLLKQKLEHIGSKMIGQN